LWSWGYNKEGQLGNNTTASSSSPIQVPGTQWNDISAGNSFSLARKSDGTLWSWGYNNCGQLGQNNLISRSSPVQVPGTSWNDIGRGGSTFADRSLARKSDGTLWAWGHNFGGPLGDNTTIDRSSPVQVPGTQWSDVARGIGATLAIKTQ
jgi:alpha-tubulin suppressor-like RCC1 family protein